MKLILEGKDYGTVGEKTNYRTVHGEDVHVGDLVKTTCFNGCISVVEPMVKSQIGYDETKVFVMGVEMMCDDVAGTIEGNKILEIVKPYTALMPGDKVGKQNIEVVGEQEETKELPGVDIAEVVMFSILDKAIKDLKDSDKDYHGLSFIKTLLQEAMK